MSDENTIKAPSEFDAMLKLREDEPYFVLIGRDEFAPGLVADWADKNRRRALAEAEEGKIGAERLDHELRQSTQAETLSWKMTDYRKGFREVEPKPESRPTYTGHVLPEATAATDKERRTELHACSVIHNSIAELSQIADDLLDVGNSHHHDVRDVIGKLSKIAGLIQPKRPGMDA